MTTVEVDTLGRVEKGSFIRFVYPFFIDPPQPLAAGTSKVDPLSVFVEAVDKGSTKYRWNDRPIIKSYVLPHLSEHLNVPISERECRHEVAHWWELESLAGHIPRGQAVPTRWEIATRQRGAERRLPFRIESIETVIFRTSVGLLIIDVVPGGDCAADWLDVQHFGRFFKLATPSGEKSGSFERRAPLIQPIGTEMSEHLGLTDEKSGFGELIRVLVDDLLGEDRWRRSPVPGRLLTFSAFFVECDETDRFRFEFLWRRMLNSGSTVAATTHDDLHGELEPYADGMTLSYSIDGGGFLGINRPDDSPFFVDELSLHLRRPYFFGFALACHQRFALARMSEYISALWDHGAPETKAVIDLQDEFIVYQSSCSFVQALQAENHHRSHRKWLKTLEVDDFQREVEKELSRIYEKTMMQERLSARERAEDDDRRARGAERAFAIVGLAFALPAIVLAAIAATEPGGVSPAIVWPLTAALVLVGMSLGWLGIRIRDRLDRRDDPAQIS